MINKTSIESMSAKDSTFAKLLNKSLRIFFMDALRITLKKPTQAFSFLRTIGWLRSAAKLRESWKQNGV